MTPFHAACLAVAAASVVLLAASVVLTVRDFERREERLTELTDEGDA